MSKKKTEICTDEKVTYTKKEVIKLLEDQIVECAKKIDADNLSQYTARKKIYETELVKL